jgi:hypothetical protein
LGKGRSIGLTQLWWFVHQFTRPQVSSWAVRFVCSIMPCPNLPRTWYTRKRFPPSQVPPQPRIRGREWQSNFF